VYSTVKKRENLKKSWKHSEVQMPRSPPDALHAADLRSKAEAEGYFGGISPLDFFSFPISGTSK
jgi:hypothetical protein